MPVNQSLTPSLYPPHLGLPGVQILCYLSELGDWSALVLSGALTGGH